eukprot:6135113-Ditylum_brightwellii.AAC.1
MSKLAHIFYTEHTSVWNETAVGMKSFRFLALSFFASELPAFSIYCTPVHDTASSASFIPCTSVHDTTPSASLVSTTPCTPVHYTASSAPSTSCTPVHNTASASLV